MNERLRRGLEKIIELEGKKNAVIDENFVPKSDFEKYILEFVFGDIFSRTGLALREKEIATISTLATLGREPQLMTHFKIALNAGITVEELQEVFLQIIPYAGFPAALNANYALEKYLAQERERSEADGVQE